MAPAEGRARNPFDDLVVGLLSAWQPACQFSSDRYAGAAEPKPWRLSSSWTRSSLQRDPPLWVQAVVSAATFWPWRAQPIIAASTRTHRLLPSRRWRRTAGPRPKQVLGYLVTSVPPTEAGMPGCDRDWSGSWGARTVPLMALRAPTKVEPRRPLSSCAQEGRRGSRGIHPVVVNSGWRCWFQP
jgi:hypothetical protein